MKHNPTSRKVSSLGYSFPSGVFYARHARDFNFELNEEELLKKALKCGFIWKVYSTKGTKYTYNPNYGQ